MRKQFAVAARMLLVLSLLTGVVYPLLVTLVAQLAFPAQANGSLILEEGEVRGSRLVGQLFDDPRYFWGRPSATIPPYNASASSGSNLGPTNPALAERIEQRRASLGGGATVPVDLLTASGSGLDPHISPAAARFQVARVAAARNMPEAELRALVERYVEGRLWGLFGEPRVDVLELNLSLPR